MDYELIIDYLQHPACFYHLIGFKNEKVIEQQREQVFYHDLDEKTNYRYVQST